MGISLIYIGLAIVVVGQIWFLISAFRESLLWGLGCLFLPFVSLIFLFVHWRVAGRPFLVTLVGGMLLLGGGGLESRRERRQQQMAADGVTST